MFLVLKINSKSKVLVIYGRISNLHEVNVQMFKHYNLKPTLSGSVSLILKSVVINRHYLLNLGIFFAVP